MSPKKLSGAQIRQTFINFFVEQGHTAVPSSSLVPGGDATLLFTNSGMVQFKDVFLGTDKRPYTRAVDSQKCMRVAGKHNDLDDVGRDDQHHTFFEMLGNWSFGDYYKKEAIQWAWQLLTEVWGLPKDRIWATVFKDDKGKVATDEEAASHWQAQAGFSSDHLLYFGRKDNFWEMAETGPCGPCSEIHYDRGLAYCDKQDQAGHVCKVNGDCRRFLELWNLVFIQYNRINPEKLEPLPATHVDTGMGFERIVSVLQDVDSNYKTDLFTPLLDATRSLTGQTEAQMKVDFTPYRVIADHARAAAFLIADGVVPGNTGRNYVTRMIIRRASRFGGKLGLGAPFLGRVAEAVIATYGTFYPELEANRSAILDDIAREERRFARTVESGTAQLQSWLDSLRKSKTKILDGGKAFDLYATYGLPFEITRDIAREQNLEVDEDGFRVAMDQHRLASGGGKAMGALGGEDADFFAGILSDLQISGKLPESGVDYDPYTRLRSEGEVLALIVDGRSVQSASFGEKVEVILPATGFYVESGGQVSDTGYIRNQFSSGNSQRNSVGWEIEISEVRKRSAGVIVHLGEVLSGQPRVGDPAVAEVDPTRRHDIMRNHTATHLLHAALHQVLGEHARQAGSLVAPDKLRFDFNHSDALDPEQLERIESLVNQAVFADMLVASKLKSRQDAIAEGAMALFGEKYGETVRTITITPEFPDPLRDDGRSAVLPTSTIEQQPKYSYELCGGTHLDRTSDVGVFIIVSEASAAAGVRRIEAVTGRAAYDLISRRFKVLKQTASKLKSAVDEIPERVADLLTEVEDQKRSLMTIRSNTALAEFNLHLPAVKKIKGVDLLIIKMADLDDGNLRKLADRFREKYSTRAVCVILSTGESIRVMATVTHDLVKQGIKAGELVAHLSSILGAKGGGSPQLAIGGGRLAGKVDEALQSVDTWLSGKLD
jgi:alanyl-tRNA synthetase